MFEFLAPNWVTGLNSLGLVLDILGVVLLFKFGLPASISRTGTSFLALEGEDKAERAKAQRYDFWARVGLALLIVGFLLQLISNYG